VRETIRRVPVWTWLLGIVGVSFVVRALLAREMVAPFIMVDELVYSELGRSVADHAAFTIRGVSASGYGIVYPLLIAPAYALFDSLPDAYAAVKTINALVMSLAALPAYWIARFVVGRGLALLGAVLAVALPSLVYTGTVMTENAFYPVFLLAVGALLWALERPTPARQAALLGALGLAYATRSQAIALVAAALSAPLLAAALGAGTLRRQARAFAPTYAVVVAGLVVLTAVQAARGRELSDLLGAYSVVGDGSYDVGEALRFLLYHGALLTLYVGVVPVAAAIVLVGKVRSLDAALQRQLAVTLATSFWVLLVVSVFASRFASRIQERNMFALAPLLLVVLLAWVARGAPRPQPLAAIAATASAALVLAIPFERFIGTSAQSDTLTLLPWWSIQDRVGIEWVAELALALAALLALLFLLVPARAAIAVPLVVLAYFALSFYPIWSGKHGLVRASEGALFQGIRGAPRDWIDQAVPGAGEGDVVVLWTGRADRFTVNQNEFFNRAVGDVYYTDQPTPGGVGEVRVAVDPADGVLRRADGTPVTARWALLDGSVTPDGVVLARDDRLGTTLWQLSGPLSSTTKVEGLYPNDTWSGPEVTYTKLRCSGGTLAVALSSDPSLFPGRRQRVTASSGGGGGETSRATVAFSSGEVATLRIPLVPEGDRCIARFTVSPTAVPEDVLPGSVDDRELGVHFNGFVLEPGR
jgi:hypothetical protein